MSSAVRFHINDRPPTHLICDLREAIGWKRNEDDYPAVLDRYDTTVSAYDNDDNTLVGWCSVVTDGARHGFFVDLIVHPRWQRQGIGSSLVLAALDDLRARGIALVHADFSADHIPFYKNCGFHIGSGGFMEL